jgi:thioredoxin-related protein
MKTTLSLVFLTMLLIVAVPPTSVSAADPTKASRAKIYDEDADGFKQVADALSLAKKDGKRVLLDFGYNGCVWCAKLHALFESDATIKDLLKSNFIVVYIDWRRGSRGGHNLEVDAKYQARTLYGAPSLVVLDSDGNRLLTKDTAELEAGNHHDPKKVADFLKKWAPPK